MQYHFVTATLSRDSGYTSPPPPPPPLPPPPPPPTTTTQKSINCNYPSSEARKSAQLGFIEINIFTPTDGLGLVP